MVDATEWLAHHGVKGQRWGVRRSAHSQKELKVRAKRAKIATNRRHISDEQLTSYVSRLEKEKKLKSLTEEDLTPGKAVTKAILSDAGQRVAKTVLVGAALYGVKVAFDKKFNPPEPGSTVKRFADAGSVIARGGFKK